MRLLKTILFVLAALMLSGSPARAARADTDRAAVVDAFVKLHTAPRVQMTGKGRFHLSLFNCTLQFREQYARDPEYACAIELSLDGRETGGRVIKPQKTREFLAGSGPVLYRYRKVNDHPWSRERVERADPEEEDKIRADYAGRILEVIPIASDEKEETLAAMTAVVAEAGSDDLPGNARRRQIGESLYILTLDKATGRPLRLMWDYSPLMQEIMKQQLSPGSGSGEVPDRQVLETDAFIHSISMLCTVDFAYDSNTVITVPGEALLAPEKEAETPFLNPFGMHEGSVLQSL